MNGHGAKGAHLEEIRADLEQTRADLGDTLAALVAKTDVRLRARRAVGSARHRARERALAAREAAEVAAGSLVRRNGHDRPPGTGGRHLAGDGGPPSRAADGTRGAVGDRVRQAAGGLGTQAGERARQIAERARQVGSHAARQGSGAGQDAAHQAGRQAGRRPKIAAIAAGGAAAGTVVLIAVARRRARGR